MEKEIVFPKNDRKLVKHFIISTNSNRWKPKIHGSSRFTSIRMAQNYGVSKINLED